MLEIGLTAITIILSVAITYILVYTSMGHLSWDKKSRLALLAPISVYVLVYVIDIATHVMPSFEDESKYISTLQAGTTIGEFSGVVQEFYIFVSPIRIIRGGVPVHIVLSAVGFVLGAALIQQAWTLITDRQPTVLERVILSGFLLFWPAAIMYLSGVLREGYVMLVWGAALYGMAVVATDTRNLEGSAILIVATVCVFFLRKELLPAIVIFAAVVIAWQYRSHIRYIVVVMFPTIVVTYFAAKRLGYAYLFDPDRIQNLRNARTAGLSESAYGTSVSWDSWVDIAVQSILFAILFLTSPSTTTSQPLVRFIASADAVFVIVVFAIAVAWCVFQWYNGEFAGVGWMVAVVFVTLGFGLFEFHITGAVRHRMAVVVCILPLSAAGLARVITYVTDELVLRWPNKPAHR